jgi:F0F1-type ATP synthase epsilon subunit
MSSEAGGFRVDVVSPERVLYSGEASQVITRTLGGGEIAFLPGHVAFLGALVENHTRIYQADGKVVDVAVHGGFVEVSGTTVTPAKSTSSVLAVPRNALKSASAVNTMPRSKPTSVAHTRVSPPRVA